MHAFEG
jgi:acetyl esterase